VSIEKAVVLTGGAMVIVMVVPALRHGLGKARHLVLVVCGTVEVSIAVKTAVAQGGVVRVNVRVLRMWRRMLGVTRASCAVAVAVAAAAPHRLWQSGGGGSNPAWMHGGSCGGQ
jgi:hypothetical protein